MTYKPKYLSNQISLVRDTAYNKIKEIVAASDIVTPKVSEKLDINLKNTVNKILNDYIINFIFCNCNIIFQRWFWRWVNLPGANVNMGYSLLYFSSNSFNM